MSTTTLSLPTAAFVALLAPFLEQWKAEYLAQLPALDPQYPVLKVAEVLSVTANTVREYFLLPVHHPRHLPYVDTTGTSRGYRVLHSTLTAWQQRNLSNSAPVEVPVHRPAQRRS